MVLVLDSLKHSHWAGDLALASSLLNLSSTTIWSWILEDSICAFLFLEDMFSCSLCTGPLKDYDPSPHWIAVVHKDITCFSRLQKLPPDFQLPFDSSFSLILRTLYCDVWPPGTVHLLGATTVLPLLRCPSLHPLSPWSLAKGQMGPEVWLTWFLPLSSENCSDKPHSIQTLLPCGSIGRFGRQAERSVARSPSIMLVPCRWMRGLLLHS